MMTTSTACSRSPDATTDVPARPLAEAGDEVLVRSAQGFLLVFRGRKWAAIARQLRTFDADEWHNAIASCYRIELDGLAEERLRAAGPLLRRVPGDAIGWLDARLLAAAGDDLHVYNLLQSTTPFRVQARLQALAVLPMLRWELARLDDASDRVRRRIDGGKSVWEAFLDIHPGRAAILRRIAASPSGPEAWRGNLAKLLEVLDPLPPEKVPRSEAEWNAFHSIYLGVAMEREDRDARLALKSRWLQECARLGWCAAYERLARIEGGVAALADACDFLDEVGAAGDWLAEQAGEAVPWEEWRRRSAARWQRAPEALGVFRIVEASVRWHRQLWADAGLPEDADSRRTTWPRLLPQPLALDDGVVAYFLGSAVELRLEGARMQHCVGSYWHHCFAGASHIVSLRDALGHSLSTLELRLPRNGAKGCDVAQHRALRNRTPDAGLRALENRLCANVIQHADFEMLAEWRHQAAKIEARLSESEIDALIARFSKARFDRLAGVLGKDRLVGLFNDVKRGR